MRIGPNIAIATSDLLKLAKNLRSKEGDDRPIRSMIESAASERRRVLKPMKAMNRNQLCLVKPAGGVVRN